MVRDIITQSGGYKKYAHCVCDCGNEKLIRLDGIKSGAVKSCGCFNRKAKTRHGYLAKDYPHRDVYYCWRSMVARCHNPNDSSFARYGGRGIVVCDKWRGSFDLFFRDVGTKPGTEYSLDRINNNLGYHPENVRWATSEEQARNRRSNRLLVWNSERLTLTEWAERYGVKPATLWVRIRSGWSMGEALELHGPRGPGRWKSQETT